MLSERPFVFAAGLCFICSFLLTFAASSLKPLQLKNQALDKQKNILKVLRVIDDTQPYTNADIDALYTTYVKNKWVNSTGDIGDEKTDFPIFIYVKNNQVDAYAIPISGYGLWSTLYGYFQLKAMGKPCVALHFMLTGKPQG